ncbi:ribonucleoside-diphosphate reductase large chain [Colletotrichum spaethianum]|uniref:Ribonucleoside-diphosphate reductase large chain n=1 Tax=Colletotrichum spaethianum TaxID=700344 RepID=A0AA37NSW5_9PEZI|nr:ribonucleoside-diphosphate reductase large chain [Colletotrichum spaethianum]GKT40177.1 ribonucleoside-diphosphate reductase large chain [Colletotrichum spaethianum]
MPKFLFVVRPGDLTYYISTFRRQPFCPFLFINTSHISRLSNQKMHSIRRAATRATLTSSVSAAAVAPKSQTISSALRALNAAAISARYFSVAAPRAFSRSVAFRDEQQYQQEEGSQAPREQRQPRQDPSEHVLFVQNYSFDVKPDDLSEAFSKYGEVVGVSMPPKRTFCFVYFKDAESVITAAENVDGTFWHGRRIVAKPRPAGERPQGGRRDSGDRGDGRPARVNRAYDGPPTNTLYVGNIAFEASDADLNNLFASLKDVTDVRVAVDRATGWPRGFAHADFASIESAAVAIESLKGAQIRGRDLKVSFAPATKETGRKDRQNRKGRNPRERERGNNRSRDYNNSQKEVEERVEVEHEQAEEAQKEQKPEAGKQDMNWNA